MEDSKTTVLPEGNYKVVSFALDLTGKKLIDEICHIGAFFHPDHAFSQYVMPYRDVSQSSVRAHGIKVFTNFGRFRVLKDLSTMKTLRTKSEFSTLNEFIEWMKKGAGDNTDGIILAYHDNNMNNIVPFFLDALSRYKLLDDFFAVVKGFVSCHAIALDKLESKEKERSITLKALLRKVLEYDEGQLNSNPLESAKKRARLTYEIIAKILKTDGEIPSDLVRNYITGRDKELENLEKQKVLANKVRSLRPIFAPQIRRGTKERGRAVALRRYLIDMQINYETLHIAFDTGSRDGIIALVGSTDTKTVIAAKKTQDKRKKQDLEDLADLVAAHFMNGGNKSDINGNKLILSKEIGAGEPMKVSPASSTETDEDEFEEAKDDDLLEVEI